MGGHRARFSGILLTDTVLKGILRQKTREANVLNISTAD